MKIDEQFLKNWENQLVLLPINPSGSKTGTDALLFHEKISEAKELIYLCRLGLKLKELISNLESALNHFKSNI